ncbi:hypothetical protein QTP70_000257 [Hemibagrus guttatus]|uniref:Uncharacterized protein n=1 Tax=Hemibagrus guttatus TaxID=175788 RepID=A0AAE0QTW3_9TELE|nr:hypothetical protein QTP70_000257 [Hemibagrus guttatus]
MVKRRGLIRRSEGFYALTVVKNSIGGASSSPGLNTPRTPSSTPQWASPPFSVSWAINLHCFPGQESPPISPSWTSGLHVVRKFGRGPTFVYREQSGNVFRRIDIVALTPPTGWGKECDCPPAT